MKYVYIFFVWIVACVVFAQWDGWGGIGTAKRAPSVSIVSGPDVGTPIAWWKMTDTGTNTTQILDFAGSYNASNMPTVGTGPTLTTTNGAFYRFDGADDYFFCSTTALLPNTNDCSVSIWFWLNSEPAGDGTLYSEDGTGDQTTKIQIESTDRKIYFLAYKPSAYVTVISSNVVALKEWTHFVMTRAGTNCMFYVNGKYDTNAPTRDVFTAPRDKVAIGATRYGTSSTAALWQNQDLIDDVRIFTNALSATQITNIFNAGRQ